MYHIYLFRIGIKQLKGIKKYSKTTLNAASKKTKEWPKEMLVSGRGVAWWMVFIYNLYGGRKQLKGVKKYNKRTLRAALKKTKVNSSHKRGQYRMEEGQEWRIYSNTSSALEHLKNIENNTLNTAPKKTTKVKSSHKEGQFLMEECLDRWMDGIYVYLL